MYVIESMEPMGDTNGAKGTRWWDGGLWRVAKERAKQFPSNTSAAAHAAANGLVDYKITAL